MKSFGDRPKAQDDFTILKEKQFSKLPMSQILTPEARETLNRWLSTTNDQDKFTGRIFFTLREMFTVVKNKMADKPTSQDHHASHAELSVALPRFDKVIMGMKDVQRKKMSSC